MVAHLTDPGKGRIDKIARSRTGTVGQAFAAVNAGRAKKGEEIDYTQSCVSLHEGPDAHALSSRA